MVKRKKVVKEKYDVLALEVTDFSANVDASINYKVRDPKQYESDAKVYTFSSSVEIHCRSTWPEKRANVPYTFSIHGSESEYTDFNLTLDDCHVIDDFGKRHYKKVRGKLKPVYHVPSGIGMFKKIWGKDRWSGFAWVSPTCFRDMLVLLVGVRPLYAFIHETYKDRTHWISSFTLQTNDPIEE